MWKPISYELVLKTEISNFNLISTKNSTAKYWLFVQNKLSRQNRFVCSFVNAWYDNKICFFAELEWL